MYCIEFAIHAYCAGVVAGAFLSAVVLLLFSPLPLSDGLLSLLALLSLAVESLFAPLSECPLCPLCPLASGADEEA